MLIANYKPPKRKDPLIFIILSVVVASVITVYPVSYDVAAWRPAMMMMVMLFWVLCQPSWCGVWFAFTMGIFTDLLIDAPLGQNALVYILISFAARYFVREKRILTFLNLWIIAILTITIYILLISVAQIMANVDYSLIRCWQPLISSTLVWPILYYSLKKWRV
ncbi:rod shape-determining protein MreD [Acinetobacter nectaris]|uniref:rod shape-determining protein MreD n=1 Tax=Acinetobacter nectaris TaxID=1219382 RepID=UPI001F01B0D0|nr:rod shape-determining protein MreD [Acinetobacter nectaris]MCF9034322.1 rod shape-determining protein MreD [Acinetobacter nectaris]